MTTAPKPGSRVRVTWPVDLSTERGVKRLRPGMTGTVEDATDPYWLGVAWKAGFCARVYRGFVEEVTFF